MSNFSHLSPTSSLLLLLVWNKLADSLLGRFCVFWKTWKGKWAELWRCTVCGLHAWSTPVGGWVYRKHAAGNSIERKRLYRGHQSHVAKCLWAELYSYPACNTLLPLIYSFPSLSSSLFASADCGVLALLFSREIRLTCWGLKGIFSAHQVWITLLFFLQAAPLQNVKETEEHIKTYCTHSVCCCHTKWLNST